MVSMETIYINYIIYNIYARISMVNKHDMLVLVTTTLNQQINKKNIQQKLEKNIIRSF